MMTKLFKFIVFTASLLTAYSGQAEIWVVVHPSNPTKSMSKSEVSALYLGRYQAFKDGSFALPFDQNADGEFRKEFYQQLTGKSVSFINAYWARILFTGRATPPRQVEDNDAVIDVVKKNPSAIGYVAAGTKLDGVKVVLRL
ncbi:MAG: hypothetical protein E6Q86_01170 [Tolumonas sp.]|jgi:ABC-type phosphate transport system substrate-binding protein|nr:MAG: hypothetical protein E6Q86_01170 [Tolumonas sp.]